MTAKTAAQAFKRIANYGKKLTADKVAFVSRGDASGTNKKELALGAAAGVTSDATQSPTGSWYITAAGGMLPCLQVAGREGCLHADRLRPRGSRTARASCLPSTAGSTRRPTC